MMIFLGNLISPSPSWTVYTTCSLVQNVAAGIQNFLGANGRHAGNIVAQLIVAEH
jgi:hypothetical protein